MSRTRTRSTPEVRWPTSTSDWTGKARWLEVKRADYAYALTVGDSEALDQHHTAWLHSRRLVDVTAHVADLRRDAQEQHQAAMVLLGDPAHPIAEAVDALQAAEDTLQRAERTSRAAQAPQTAAAATAAMDALYDGMARRAIARGMWAHDLVTRRRAQYKAGEQRDPIPNVADEDQGATVTEVERCAAYLDQVRAERDKYRDAVPLDAIMAESNRKRLAYLEQVLAGDVEPDPSAVARGSA